MIIALFSFCDMDCLLRWVTLQVHYFQSFERNLFGEDGRFHLLVTPTAGNTWMVFRGSDAKKVHSCGAKVAPLRKTCAELPHWSNSNDTNQQVRFSVCLWLRCVNCLGSLEGGLLYGGGFCRGAAQTITNERRLKHCDPLAWPQEARCHESMSQVALGPSWLSLDRSTSKVAQTSGFLGKAWLLTHIAGHLFWATCGQPACSVVFGTWGLVAGWTDHLSTLSARCCYQVNQSWSMRLSTSRRLFLPASAGHDLILECLCRPPPSYLLPFPPLCHHVAAVSLRELAVHSA